MSRIVPGEATHFKTGLWDVHTGYAWAWIAHAQVQVRREDGLPVVACWMPAEGQELITSLHHMATKDLKG